MVLYSVVVILHLSFAFTFFPTQIPDAGIKNVVFTIKSNHKLTLYSVYKPRKMVSQALRKLMSKMSSSVVFLMSCNRAPLHTHEVRDEVLRSFFSAGIL